MVSRRFEGAFITDLSDLSTLILTADIATELGIDESVAKAAVAASVGRLTANAADKGKAPSLDKALGKRTGEAPRQLAEIDEAVCWPAVASRVRALRRRVLRRAGAVCSGA